MAKSSTEHKMIKYQKPLEFFKELLNGRDETPYPVLVGLYVSDNEVSLAKGDNSCLRARYCGECPVGNLDDLVENLQSLQRLAGFKLRGIIVSGNNSVTLPVNIHTLMDELCKKGNFESLKYTYFKDRFKSRRADLSGITFPIRRQPMCHIEAPSAVRMLQVALDFLNTLVDRKNFRIGEEDS